MYRRLLAPILLIAETNTTSPWYNDPTQFFTVTILTVVIGYALYRLAKYIFDNI